LEFSLKEDGPVTIGFDCPKGEGNGLGGFQVDNIRLFQVVNEDITRVETMPSTSSSTTTYYSLSGMPLTVMPDNGIVIRKEGGKVSKLLIKR
jgi:hypothetical protein